MSTPSQHRSGSHRAPEPAEPTQDTTPHDLNATDTDHTESTPPRRRRRQPKKVNGLLVPSVRSGLIERAAQGGLLGKIASVRLEADDNRRRVRAQRKEMAAADGFDRDLLTLTPRGFAGRGGGRQPVVPRAMDYRATSIQVAGLWPWAVGARAPLVGTPVGTHLQTGAPVGFDPLSWFKAKMITAPIAFVLSLNGFGKSSLVRRMVLGALFQGQRPLILGDVKPDYRDLIAQCGGQIIELGYGFGVLNPLEVGALGEIIELLPPATDGDDPRSRVRQEVAARQVSMVSSLIEVVREQPVQDFEQTLIRVALANLYRPTDEGGRGFTAANPPILSDLLDVVSGAGDAALMRAVAVSSAADYDLHTRRLRQSLEALVDGPFGDVFNGQTTTKINVTSPGGVCVDVSRIPQGDTKLKAAVLSVCWASGFGAVEAANTLADYQLGPQLEFLAVLDELWQVLGTSENMVDRVNELTRLNRSWAVGMLMISHSIEDLSMLSSPAAVKKAKGFIQRARVKVIGPIPEAEVDALSGVTELTATERAWVTAWASTAGSDGTAQSMPFGMGKFLLKDSEDSTPGVPIQHHFTPTDRTSKVHETSARFDAAAANARSNRGVA